MESVQVDRSPEMSNLAGGAAAPASSTPSSTVISAILALWLGSFASGGLSPETGLDHVQGRRHISRQRPNQVPVEVALVEVLMQQAGGGQAVPDPVGGRGILAPEDLGQGVRHPDDREVGVEPAPPDGARGLDRLRERAPALLRRLEVIVAGEALPRSRPEVRFALPVTVEQLTGVVGGQRGAPPLASGGATNALRHPLRVEFEPVLHGGAASVARPCRTGVRRSGPARRRSMSGFADQVGDPGLVGRALGDFLEDAVSFAVLVGALPQDRSAPEACLLEDLA